MDNNKAIAIATLIFGLCFVRIFLANSQPNSDDEEEEDNDYSPEEDEFKKVCWTFKRICFAK